MQQSRWKEFQGLEKNSLCVHNIIFIILLPPKQRFLGITIPLFARIRMKAEYICSESVIF